MYYNPVKKRSVIESLNDSELEEVLVRLAGFERASAVLLIGLSQ